MASDKIPVLVNISADQVIELLKERGTLVEVVRCGECKFSDWYESVDGEQLCYCIQHGSTRHKETDYCNYGEREVQE